MLKKIIFILITLGFVLTGYSQINENDTTYIEPADTISLKAYVNFHHGTNKIKDGIIKLKITGGVPPYLIKWSNQSTALNTETAENLTEGKEYQITITDAEKTIVEKTVVIPVISLDEKINAAFRPLVVFIDKIIMTDIFAALNLYDPVIHDKNGKIVYHPNGDPQKMCIPFVVVWLLIGALFFTFRMKFINLRGFKHALHLVQGKYTNPNDKGEVSHFQALATALSATVGLGNIAGVAIAISLGGPGATFWMIIAGFLGMSSKFVECTLGVKYRTIDKKGQVSGGPMYYLSRGLEKKNLGGLGKVLATIFAVLIIGGSLGGGNMFQANQAFSQFSSLIPGTEAYAAYFGVILAILVGVVIIGGIKSIARITEKIVPFMAILYVGTALVIIVMNIKQTPEAISLIFNGAFSPDALKGGIVGVLVVGIQRAAFSNEAGVGSAAVAHAAVKTNEPITEGIVALLEPFIDTIIICTMTALVIIFTGYYDNTGSLDGVQLTSEAFASVFSWFPYLLVVAITLFAFSTMISWSYYGLKGFNYLFGRFFKNKRVASNIYYVIFLFFIVVGASSSLGSVLDFSDMMILSMAFPNILGLYLLAGEVKDDLKNYFKRIKSGEIKRYK